MRRSRSLSNIPMPYNGRRDSKSKRAKSTLRNSRDPSLDGQTPLARRLETPTTSGYRLGAEGSDQKYRTQKTITPSYTGTGFKRSGSVSSFGSRISLTNNKSPLEKKSIQKMLNDKKWVAEQYSKVQSFIQTSGHFNPELSGMIRPPTINTVVELFSVLLRLLIKTDPINSQSYGDVVLRTLKLLNYPGTITLSTLKTVNTMHGWPHFIFIISWLIERVDLHSVNHAFRDQQGEELKQMFSLQDSVFEFLTAQHSIYTAQAPDQILLIESENKLYDDMLILTGTNPKAAQILEQPIEIIRAEVAELETQLQEITEENQKIQLQNLERQEIIKKFKERSSTKEEDLDAELSQLRKLRYKQAETKNTLTLSVQELKNVVAGQSGRYNEKAQLIGQIEDLKRAIDRKEKKLKEYRAVKDQLDHDLTTMVKEIEAKVDAWNVSITKTLLPEMQNLRLREKGFHSKGFIEELREVCKEKEEITKQLQQEYKTINLDIEEIQKKRESFEKNNKSLNVTKKKLSKLKCFTQRAKEEARNLLLKIDEVKKQFDTNEMEKRSLEIYKIKEAEMEIAEHIDRIQKITEKTDKAAKKGLSVIVEIHNLAIQSMLKIEEVDHFMLKDMCKIGEQSKQNLMETFNTLLYLQEQTDAMIQDYEENKENHS